jgi:DNA-binding NarL/FixJ family response regulator
MMVQQKQAACRRQRFESFVKARDEAQRFSRNTGHTVTPYQCERCGKYHNRSSRAILDETDLLILEHIARGLRDREIGRDLQIPETAVTRRVFRMMERTGTISRPNLVAFAMHHEFISYKKIMGSE